MAADGIDVLALLVVVLVGGILVDAVLVQVVELVLLFRVRADQVAGLAALSLLRGLAAALLPPTHGCSLPSTLRVDQPIAQRGPTAGLRY